MCGIVGYIGHREAAPILMDGLARLSYRGYDSAGLAVIDQQNRLHVRKTGGKLSELEKKVSQNPIRGVAGIAHTRWATHGKPNERNAHPHLDESGTIAVVHNGIIENHLKLRRMLQEQDVSFVSETDSEVIAHLIRVFYNGSMIQTIKHIQPMLEGSYAICIVCTHEPDKLFCLKKNSSLVMGFHSGEGFIASDLPAVLKHTRDVVFLKDHEFAIISTEGIEIFDEHLTMKKAEFSRTEWKPADIEKGVYSHFMLKEIFDQPTAIRKTVESCKKQLFRLNKEFFDCKKITIVACGTSFHAGLYGKYVLEELANIPASVEVASEYRYRNPVIAKNELVVAVSQSGETADTLAAIRLAGQAGAKTMCICNVPNSSLVREVGECHTLLTSAGPEIAVASTKAFVTQALVLLMLSVKTGEERNTISALRLTEIKKALENADVISEKILLSAESVQQLTTSLTDLSSVFFFGRGLDYPIALEAALKLKEISYLTCEGYPAGEMKHGPLALVDEKSLTISCATQPALLDKMLANMEEVSSRGSRLIAVTTEALAQTVRLSVSEMIVIPDTDPFLAPLLSIIPFQLFAYYAAVQRGCDVDQPRNLAKSVTVE